MAGHAYSAPAVRQRLSQTSRRRPGPATALGVAVLCVLALALLWVLASQVAQVRFKDAVVLHDFTLLSGTHVNEVGNFLLHLLEPLLFVCWGLALVAIALARSQPRAALAAVAVMGLAPLTSETLKPLLAHPHVVYEGSSVGAASWPSGHSTAALALALSAVLVSPPRLRPWVAVLGALFAALVGCFLLILAWHMPTDVIGGYLVASLWTALAVAALRASERRRTKDAAAG